MVRENIAVKCSCKVLEVSRSGYYKWRTRPESERAKSTKELTKRVLEIHSESRNTYGEPRIKIALKDEGVSCGKERIVKIMKKLSISGISKKKFKIKTTDSNHDFPIADRIFQTENWETHPTKPNQIWASDISYIRTDEGFLFLGTYLDLYTRKLVGFSMADHMRTELLLDALTMALGRQMVNPGELTTHSDRGVQYASGSYREELKALQIIPSMSRSGNCYDNAFAESFFATLKKELIYRCSFKTREEAKTAIFEYIECWYNRKRIHSSLGHLTPIMYEEQHYAA
jgi:transposase InsO family protein